MFITLIFFFFFSVTSDCFLERSFTITETDDDDQQNELSVNKLTNLYSEYSQIPWLSYLSNGKLHFNDALQETTNHCERDESTSHVNHKKSRISFSVESIIGEK